MSDNGKDIRRALKAAAQTPKKPNPYKDDVIYDPMGQWKYPGQVTRIPSNNITMQGVPYPVLGVDNLGNQQMMQPGAHYTFPGQYVTEYPQMAQEGKTILPKDYSEFEEYNKTAPKNRVPDKDWQYGNSKQYDHYGMWDALGKPKNFEEALKNNPDWQPDEYDHMYHGFSANPNTGVWLKPFTPGEHEPGSTAWMEYVATQLNPELAKNYRVIYDTDLKRMKGVPKEKYGGWLDDYAGGGDKGRTPIYTNDPNDPRLKAYTDSLDSYNFGVKSIGRFNNAIKKGKERGTPLKYISRNTNTPWMGTNILPIESAAASPTGTPYGSPDSDTSLWESFARFKKPVQEVIYKEKDQLADITDHGNPPVIKSKVYPKKAIKKNESTIVHTDKAAYDKAYKAPIKEQPKKEEPKKTEPVKKAEAKKDYTTRNVDFSSPYGPVIKYYDELGKVIRTEPYNPNSKYEFGGAFDQYDEGGTNPPGTSDKPIASKKQAYQTAIKNNYQKYLDDIKYSTPYTDVTEGGMNCIHGVCQVVKGTGAKNFMEDYTGNQTFKDARKKEGYYEADPINEGFEIGDIIQYAHTKENMAGDARYKGKVTPANAKELVPSHAKVILDKYVDKDGITRYKIGHNQGKEEFMFSKDDDGGDIKEETLIKHFTEGYNTFEGIIVNRYDPDYVAKKEKEDADDVKKIKGENLYAPLYKGTTKIKSLEHPIPQAKELLNLYKKNYQKLGKTADMPPNVLDQIFHNEVGIYGQESEFGTEGGLKSLVPDTFLPEARKLQETFRTDDDWVTDYWKKNADDVQTKFSTKEQFAQSIKNRNKLSPEAREYLRYKGPRSKGGFQQKELSKRGRVLGANLEGQENQFLSSMYLAIDNYHLLKKKYPDLGENELVDLTTLMHNAPSKALTPEYVNYYLKNNEVDYVNKVKQKRGDIVVDTQPSYIEKLKAAKVKADTNKISSQEVSAITNFLQKQAQIPKKEYGGLNTYQPGGFNLRATSTSTGKEQNTLESMSPQRRTYEQMISDANAQQQLDNAKSAIDLAGLAFYPASIVGSILDASQGDYTGAAMGLVPFVGKAGKTGKFFRQAYTKAVNAGLPHKIAYPAKQLLKGTTVGAAAGVQGLDAYQDNPYGLVPKQDGGWIDEMQPGGTTVYHTDKAAFDKAFKAESDSLYAHNLTRHDPKWDWGNYARIHVASDWPYEEGKPFHNVNKPDDVVKVRKSKYYKKPSSKHEIEELNAFLKKTKLKPEQYKYLENRYWEPKAHYPYDPNTMMIKPPATPEVEDEIDRKLIKSKFPKATDAFITEKFNELKKKDPHYKGRIIVTQKGPNTFWDPEFKEYGSRPGYQRLESIGQGIEETISDVIPYWKKPVIHNVYDQPTADYLPQKPISVNQEEPELKLPTERVSPETMEGKRIAWRMDPQTKKMVPVIGGMKESVKNMKRLYNKDIPTAGAAIPKGFVPDYGNDIVTTFQTGGWLDELDEEFRRGGPVNPLMLTRSKRKKTSKNIQSSINKIFLRNYDIFGPGGKNIYDPKSKYEFGGDLDEYQNAGSTGVYQKPVAPLHDYTWTTPLTPMGVSKPKIRYSAKEADAWAKKAEEESRAQATKEHYQDYVQSSMKKTLEHPLFSMPGYATPHGAIIGAMQSAVNIPINISKGNYGMAGLDALGALGLGALSKSKVLSKIPKGLPKGTKKAVSSGPKVTTTTSGNNRLRKAADYEIEGAIRDIEQNPSVYDEEMLHELRGEYARRLNDVHPYAINLQPENITSSYLDRLIQNPISYNQLTPEMLASLSNLGKAGKLTKKFKKPLKEILKEHASKVFTKIDETAGNIIDPFTNPYAKTTNAAVIKEANKKLAAGLGIKKLNAPVKLIEGQGGNMHVEVDLKKFMEQHPELSEFAQHVPEGFQSTGIISLPTVGRQNRSLTDILKGKNPYNTAWGSAGLKKSGDFPFGYLDQKGHTLVSDALKKSGLSAEVNQAIKKTLQERSMDLFSGGTGHTIPGAKRYIRELMAGRVEPKGSKKSVEAFQNWVDSNKPTLEAIGSGEIPMTSAIHDKISPMIFRYKLKGGQHNNWLDNLT